MTSHTPKVLTEADLAGLPRAVSTPNDLPSVGTEDARSLADEMDTISERITRYSNSFGDGVLAIGADKIRKLVSERDALAGRVAELEAERDRLTLSRIDRECLRIGQEIQRAAGELPYGYEIEIEVERGSGSVYLSKPDYSKASFHDMVDGLSYAITEAIDAALSATTPESKP